MAAPDNATLLDYETNIEDALVTYFASALPAVQLLTHRTLITEESELQTPRITLAVTMSGTDPNQQANRTTDGGEYDSHKLAALTFLAVVRRDAAGQSLGNLRGAIREAMLKPTAALNGTNLPYYQVVTMREQGSTTSFEASNDEIGTSISYALEFYIKPDQWAA